MLAFLDHQNEVTDGQFLMEGQNLTIPVLYLICADGKEGILSLNIIFRRLYFSLFL